VQEAVSLSANASVIATLGTSSGTTVSTYNAAGLLNSILQAKSAASSSTSSTTDSSATDATSTSTDAASSTSDSSSSTQASSSDTSSSTSTDVNTDWSTILKSNPSLAGNVINYSMEQGIIGSLLDVTA
jgi:hypothetical protein